MEEEERSYCLIQTEFQFWGNEKSSGDGWRSWLHSDVNVYDATNAFKHGQDGIWPQ